MGLKVVIPGAFWGVTAAYMLDMSRAVGETMVVAIAAGQQAALVFSQPRDERTLAYITGRFG